MTVVIITKHLFQTKDPKAHDHHGEYPPSCVNFVLPNVAATKNGCPPVQKKRLPYVHTLCYNQPGFRRYHTVPPPPALPHLWQISAVVEYRLYYRGRSRSQTSPRGCTEELG